MPTYHETSATDGDVRSQHTRQGRSRGRLQLRGGAKKSENPKAHGTKVTRHHGESTGGAHEVHQRIIGVERNSQRTTSSDRTPHKRPQQIPVRGRKTTRVSITSAKKRERSHPQKHRILPEARRNPPGIEGTRTSLRGRDFHRQYDLAYGLGVSWDQCWGEGSLCHKFD